MRELATVSPRLLLNAGFADIDELCQAAMYWDLDLRPLAAPASNRAAGATLQAQYGALVYGNCSLNACCDQYGGSPPGMLTFVVLDPCMKRLWWRGHDLSGNENVMVYQAGTEVRCINSEDFDVHTISVTPETVEAISESLKLRLPPSGLRPEVFKVPARLLAPIRRTLCAYRDDWTRQSGTVLQNILEVLLTAWLDFTSASTGSRPSGRARDLAIRNCLSLFESEAFQDMPLSRMCSIAGVSERTLLYAFQERFGLSPGRFLRSQRLAMVRHELRQPENGDCPIGDLAAAHEFCHHGHFNRHYKQLFGETPSDTRNRSR